MATALTQMQKRYIWLMGAFSHLLAIQGRGKRTDRLLYAVDEEAGELVIFGYSNPPMWLKARGLIRNGQAPHSYILTEEGEAEFKKLRASGGIYSTEFREVRLKKRD